MALSANTVWEVRTAGNDTNGGAFTTGDSGTDYSQQDAKNTVGSNISTMDAVAVGTGVITSATAAFTNPGILGNVIYLQGGTGSLAAGWYRVTAYTSASSITVDRNVAAGTGITMNIGGALVSPGQAAANATVANQGVYIKAGTYSITSASTNVSGGCIATAAATWWEGYNSSRGDLGTKPLLQASGISTFTIVAAGTARSVYRNLSLDGATLTSSRGVNSRGLFYRVKVANCTNGGFDDSAGTIMVQCEATGCSTVAAFLMTSGNTSEAYYCIAYDNTITGFSIGAGNMAHGCIADSNSGASSDGFSISGVETRVTGCIAYNSGRDGVRIADGSAYVDNTIAEGNAAVGFNVTGSNAICGQLVNCAGYNNTDGDTAATTAAGFRSYGFVTLTGSPFTDAANQNFALNNTASAGAACRATGYPGVLPVGGTGYRDIGALQHADPASGSGHGRYVFTNGGIDG